MAQNYSPSYLTKLKVKPVTDPYSQLRAKPAGGFSATKFLSPGTPAVPAVSAVKQTIPQSISNTPQTPFASPISMSQPFSSPTVPQVTATPASPALSTAVNRATLYGPEGQKTPVDVGSQQASKLQTQGWGLTPGSYKASPAAPPATTPPLPATTPVTSPATPVVTDGTAPGTTEPAPGTPSAPAMPTITPETQKAYDTANLAYQESLKISPDELSTQEDLDNLIESTKTAYRNTSNQPIPLEFITGQLAAIERRATGLAEPLDRKLARLQATRTASLESSKFAFERAEKKVSEEKALSAPTSVTAGTSIVKFNPATGKYENVYTAPKTEDKTAGFTLGADQARYDDAGNLIASREEKTVEPKIVKIDGIDYQQNSDGSYSVPTTPEIPTSPEQKTKTISQMSFLKDTADKAWEYSGAAGQSPVWDTMKKVFKSSTKKEKLKGLVDTLKTNVLSLLTDPIIKKFFGPQMSEADVRMMMAGGSTLSADSQNPELMREELLRLQGLFDRIKESVNKGLSGESGETGDALDQALDKIGFKNGGGGTPTATKIADAIKQVESGGNYSAQGGSGEYGAYQFMPATWKSWATKYLGDANAPMTKANQDKVALSKITDLINQGYDSKQIALIWNGGSPTIKSGVNSFGISYNTGSYANKVLNTLKNLG